MTLDYHKGENDSVTSEMALNFADMDFKSKDEQDLHFISVEHLDNS